MKFNKLFLSLLLSLALVSSSFADPIRKSGDNVIIGADSDGSITIETDNEGDINLITDQSGDNNALTIDGATGALTFSVDGAGINEQYGTIAAAGADQTDFTQVTDRLSAVTAADGNKGVGLPANPEVGSVWIVANTANAVLKVYPGASNQINALTATTGTMSMAAYTVAVCYAATAAQYWCLEGAVPA